MDDLSPQERAIHDLLQANPFLGQAEIAEQLGLARSTIAAHIVSLIRKGRILGRGYLFPEPKRIVCIGAAAVDRKYHAVAKLKPGTSNPVRGSRSFGGVARNVAENLARLGVGVSLATILGEDENGREILRSLRDLGVDASLISTAPSQSTAEYAAILDENNDLALGIADMAIFDSFGASQLDRAWPQITAAAFVFADCNLPAESLSLLIARARSAGFRLTIDTVSAPKAAKLPKDLAGVDILFVNRDEAAALLGNSLDGTRPEGIAASLRERGAVNVVLTLGGEGALAVSPDAVIRVPAMKAKPLDVTGAGDAMIAGTLYRLLSGDSLAAAARTGALLAALTTESESTVLTSLSAQALEAAMRRAPKGKPTR
jgi:pseudouridine kinase